MRRLYIIGAVLLLALPSFADETQRAALRNLRGVVLRTVVEKESPGLATLISQAEFQKAGEKQLRAAGLYVGYASQIRQRPAPPVLLLAINGATYKDALAFAVNVDLIDEVSVERPNANISASTWSADLFGLCPSDDLKLLRQAVTDALDEFIEDWQAANPKR